MATQNFKGNLFLNLYREGEKLFNICLFPPAAKERDKKCLTLAAYFLCLENPDLPACYPLTCMHTHVHIDTHTHTHNYLFNNKEKPKEVKGPLMYVMHFPHRVSE